MSVRITVLIDDSPAPEGGKLVTEHGLSIYGQTADGSMLFDTGQSGPALLTNAQALGIDLGSLSAVVLSHGHYDHTGGVPALLERHGPLKLYAHPLAFAPKCVREIDGWYRNIGSPVDAGQARSKGAQLIFCEKPLEVLPGIMVSGPIARTHALEGLSDRFYAENTPGVKQVDPFLDEQALVVNGAEGALILLGCAHVGVINTVQHCRALSTRGRVLGVAGGFHLAAASDARIAATVEFLRALDLRFVAANHCTGMRAEERLSETFGDRCLSGGAGAVFELQS